LLNKGLDIGPGLFFRVTSQIIQITIDGQNGDAQSLFQPLRHAIPAVRIAGAGLGIVKNDAFKLE
jgi:hypothetical protein